MQLALNPALDVEAHAAHFARHGWVQIRDVMTDESALAVEKALRALPWSLVYRSAEGVMQLSPERLATITPQEAAMLRRAVDEGARAGFQFLYNQFALLDRYFDEGGTRHEIFAAFEWLNGPEVVSMLRKITDLDTTRWLDGQAALYQAGHFLREHSDHSPDEPRLAAYVLSFARDWQSDWGGLLQFLDEDGDVSRALLPRFNTLNLFAVPRRHAVSQVASWSPGLRFSLTGWLRADDPPGPIAIIG